MRVFVAGATGAVGRRLVPRLRASGHDVVATTRSPDKVDQLFRLGVEALVVNGLDAAAVSEAVARTQPDAIVHQMTALVGMSSIRNFDQTFATTNALRTEGLDHLLAAARATGVQRIVAQSFTGWTNPHNGTGPATETDGFDPDLPKKQRQTLAAIEQLERAVTEAGGVALRYGTFYGPVASDPMLELVSHRKMPVVGGGDGVWSWCHVDDAASAAVAALERGSGVYNIVDDDPAPVGEWLPYFAEVIGAKPPRHLPVWLARMAAGEVGVSMLTRIRGSSNAKAKTGLGWTPRWSSWRDGFRQGLTDIAPARRG
jgi:nucleoside-diphosphate-sugar epimerase